MIATGEILFIITSQMSNRIVKKWLISIMKVIRSDMLKINVRSRLQVQILTNLQKAFVPLLDSVQMCYKQISILSTYTPLMWL